MKIIEENKLKQTITQLNNYKAEHKNIKYFYKDLDNLEVEPLQRFSFEKDREFFDEVSFILSVITSIISHPHLSNKGEDIVIRAERAGHISNEAFQQVFKESNLWKEKDLKMVPEYVHYYQYTDELKIYENLFIGMIIRLIDSELIKYSDFYISLIPSIDDNNQGLLESTKVEKTLKIINKLQRKLRFIKNTYFYKEISKENLNLKNIQPTNILLKDRLYNHCYKFYRNFIKYEDQDSLFADFKSYYKHLILKLFREKDFKLDETKPQKYSNLSFVYNDYQINLCEDAENHGLGLTIQYQNAIAKHSLLFSVDRTFNEEFFESQNYLSTDVMSLWNLQSITDGIKSQLKNNLTEKELVNVWFNSKLKEVLVKKELYSKYCPVCKSKNIEYDEEICNCVECGSIYTFKNGESKNTIWFLKVRR